MKKRYKYISKESKYQLPENLKENFTKASVELHQSIIIQLVNHTLEEPKSLDVLKSLYPNLLEYFKDNASLLNDALEKCYDLVNQNKENNLINLLEYLLSKEVIILENTLPNFNYTLMSLISRRQNDIVKYLLQHKTKEEYSFLPVITKKSIELSRKLYSLADLHFNKFPKDLQKHLTKNNFKQDQQNQLKVSGLENYLKVINGERTLADKVCEATYNLLNCSQASNIQGFINAISRISSIIEEHKSTISNEYKTKSINYLYDVFKEIYYSKCNISDQIDILKIFSQFIPESKKFLQIQIDLKTLVQKKIIDSNDPTLQEKVSSAFLNQNLENALTNKLLDQAIPVEQTEALLGILTQRFPAIHHQVSFYNNIATKMMNSTKDRVKSANLQVYIEKLLYLISNDEFEKETLLNEKEKLDYKKIAYLNITPTMFKR